MVLLQFVIGVHYLDIGYVFRQTRSIKELTRKNPASVIFRLLLNHTRQEWTGNITIAEHTQKYRKTPRVLCGRVFRV